MDIYLTNTYTGKKELFVPILSDTVTMYNCGPTVYHFAHIGNMRSYVFADTLKRMFLWSGYEVKQVINITDVGHLTSDGDVGEDKLEKGAKREGKSVSEIVAFYTNAFMADMRALGIDTTSIMFTPATEYIPEQIAMIVELEKRGYTYKTSDGIYFDTSKFPEYGKLGNINLEGLRGGARIGENDEKKNITDFAVWKFSPQTTDSENGSTQREQEWQSPWGIGFPGWHIECSAMSVAFLGSEFDIHTGGIDHIPVHHNNEIAQAVCSGHPFAHYWMHNEFVTIRSEQKDTKHNVDKDQKKISKSDGTFITLTNIAEKHINPLAYRYWLLTSHYSSPVAFSFEAVEAAQTAWKRLCVFTQSLTVLPGQSDQDHAEKVSEYEAKFAQFIHDDLNTAQALALVWELVKDTTLDDSEKKYLLTSFDQVLGLQLFTAQTENQIQKNDIPKEVADLIKARDRARAEKDFAQSDELRKEIERLSFKVLDTADGTKVERM